MPVKRGLNQSHNLPDFRGIPPNIRLSLTARECFGGENADGCFPVVPAIAGQKSVKLIVTAPGVQIFFWGVLTCRGDLR